MIDRPFLDMEGLSEELSVELQKGILPYWTKLIDRQNGGFYGQVDGRNEAHPMADKGGVLNARILWTYSAAFRICGNPEYLETARWAQEYLSNSFVDHEFGGIYWMVDYQGKPVDTKKQIYAQAFAIYGLTEFFRASKHQKSLDLAIELYRLIEKYSFDPQHSGYLEAFDQEWNLLEDLRLSEKDANEKKTMNTHLHILEAYTNLYRIWKDEGLREKMMQLIGLFLNKIIDPETYHFKLFFDEFWNSKSQIVSYGHDIEGSWLLWEAAEVLGDQQLNAKVKEVAIKMAQVALAEGIDQDGSIYYEKEGSHLDNDRHWWPQAEAVVGFLNAYQLSSDPAFLEAAQKAWKYINAQVIDKEHGEWFSKVDADGIPSDSEDKVGPWKCPYHNGRMCLEVMERVELLNC